MTSVIYPQGPIISGSSIVLAAMIGGDIYVMASSTTPSAVEMVPAFTTGTCNTTLPSNILRWTIRIVGESLTFVSTTNQYLTYSTGGTFMTQSTVPTKPIFFNQASYEEMERPSVLLSGIMYVPYGDSTTGVQLQVMVGTALQSLNLIPVPINIYTVCTAQEGNSVVSDLSLSLQLVRCSYNPTTTTSCPCSSLPPAWTDQIDCFNANTFNYCAAGIHCTGNCKSQCEDPLQVCIYQGNMTYVCEGSTPQIVPAPVQVPVTPIADSGWFVFVIILLILFIIGIFFLLYYWSEPGTVDTYSHTDIVAHPYRGPIYAH